MRRVSFLSLTALILAIGSSALLAQNSTPQVIKLQGFLNDKSGGTPVPANGPFTMLFEVFDADLGGNFVTSEGPVVVNVVDGFYEIELPIPVSDFDNPQRFIAITVEGELLSPRVRLASAPFAYVAEKVDGFEGADLEESQEIVTAVGQSLATHESSPNAHPEYVRKAGDDMSGQLRIAPSTDVGGLQITQTGTEVAAWFSSDNPDSTAASVLATSLGGSAIWAIQNGLSARAGDFVINNAQNASAAVAATTMGTGRAGAFTVDNQASNSAALFAENNGVGYALRAVQSGTGSGGSFEIVDPANSNPALSVSTSGGGPAISAATSGSGPALDVDGSAVVSGVIDATGGGVKFADGVVQTAAAASDGHSLDASDGDPVDSVFVDSEGNVGIGTTTPSSLLDVNGFLSSGPIRITNDSPSDTSLDIHHSFCSVIPPFTCQLIRARHNNQTAFNVNTQGDLYVLGKSTFNGFVGIGTQIPLAPLHVPLGGIQIGSSAISTDNFHWTSDLLGGSRGLRLYGGDVGTGSHLVTFSSGGLVGIGTTTPSEKLVVESTTRARAVVRGGGTATTAAEFVAERTNSARGAGMRVTDGANDWWVGVGYKGGQPSQDFIIDTDDTVNDPAGSHFFIERSTGMTSVRVLEIRGGMDIAEPFPTREGDDVQEGDVLVIDEINPGRLRLSTEPYDRRAAGVASGAGNINTGLKLSQHGPLAKGPAVALGGRVYVRATASNGAITPGDLLTTSDIPGHAMKVVDHARAQGAVIGKAMTSLESGTGLVLVLVSLQ